MSEHQQTQQSKESKPTFQKQATPIIQTPISNPASIIQRARINPKSLTPADVLQLQRTIGNRAVGRLLSSMRTPSTAQQAIVQRQEILEEEEPLQGKTIGTIQRQEIPEEEEPLQGKFESGPEKEICPSCIQRAVTNIDGPRIGQPGPIENGFKVPVDIYVHHNNPDPTKIEINREAKAMNIRKSVTLPYVQEVTFTNETGKSKFTAPRKLIDTDKLDQANWRDDRPGEHNVTRNFERGIIKVNDKPGFVLWMDDFAPARHHAIFRFTARDSDDNVGMDLPMYETKFQIPSAAQQAPVQQQKFSGGRGISKCV